MKVSYLYITLSQNIDYALCEAHTTYGRLGCKVWISLPSKEELEALLAAVLQRDGRRFNNRGSRGGKMVVVIIVVQLKKLLKKLLLSLTKRKENKMLQPKRVKYRRPHGLSYEGLSKSR